MHRYSILRRAPLALLALAFGLASARAQEAPPPDLKPEAPAGLEAIARRKPSFFHRPAMESPARQMAYADGLAREGRQRQAMKQYLALVHQWPDAPEAAAAELAYARLLLERGKYARAFDEFQYLIDQYTGRFPAGFAFDDALDQQFRIANRVRLAGQGGSRLAAWFYPPERALPLLERLLANAPNWRLAPEVQFDIGVIREELGEFEEAAAAYRAIPGRYAGSPFVAEARLRHALCLAETARVRRQDEQACRDALSALSAFLRDYPGHEKAETALKHLDELKEKLAGLYLARARFYEARRRPAAALIAYRDYLRNCPYAERVQDVRDRVRVLEDQEQAKEGAQPRAP